MSSRGRDTRSRLERALPDLIKIRAKARAAQSAPQAMEHYDRLLSRDPRCPGERCPPFILREAGEAFHLAGRHARGAELLAAYLKGMPKAADRKAARALMKAAQGAEEAAAAQEKAALEARQVRLPRAASEAPWLTLGRNPDYGFRHLRFGGSVGIARFQSGKRGEWLGVEAGKAAIGPLAIPAEFAWLAVGQDGAIYYVTNAGALYRAKTLSAARKPFERLEQFEDIEHWQVSGTTLVASNGRLVHVSTDGGDRFTTHRHDSPISKAWPRADGVVAFGDSAGAWVSADGGKTWDMTPLGDMTGLTRDGQRIYQSATSGSSRGFGSRKRNCAQGELTVDRQWIVVDSEYRRGRSIGWDLVFRVGNSARAPKAPANGLGEGAATKGKDALNEVRACNADPDAWFKANGGGAGGIGGRGSRCRGLDCLVRPGLPATPVHFGLLGDARCATDSKGGPRLSAFVRRTRRRFGSYGRRGTPVCGHLASAGTVMRIDPKGFSRQPAVPDCTLRDLRSVGGLGVGLCQGETSNSLVVLDGAGVVRERRALDGPVEDIALAADGTLLVQVGVDGTHQALVRRPVALGVADAWQTAKASGAAAWRAVPGGRALAILPGTRTRGVVRPTTSRADGDWTPNLGRSDFAGVKACHESALAADPTIKGTLTVIATIGGERSARSVQDVRFENGLSGETDGLLDCLDRHVRAVKLPYRAKKEVQYSFRFNVHLQSYRLALFGPEGVEPLTEDVTFDDPPEQFTVMKDGTVRVTHTTYPKQTCIVSKGGAPLCPRDK